MPNQVERYNRLSKEDLNGVKSSAYTSDFSASIRRDIRNNLLHFFLGTLNNTHHLCDLACNNGFNLKDLINQGTTICGVDLCEAAVNEATKIGVNAKVASMAHVPFDSNSIDAVTCMEALYHVPHADQLATLDEAWRILKPGGVLVIVTANLESFIRRVLPSDMFTHPYRLGTFIQHQSKKTHLFRSEYSRFPFGKGTVPCSTEASTLGWRKWAYPVVGLAWQKPTLTT